VPFTLHPDAVINTRPRSRWKSHAAALVSSAGFTFLFFWLHRLRLRVLRPSPAGRICGRENRLEVSA
jgi:hypothetical protein